MKVPAVSQLINGTGGDRCGEACLSACLAALGVKHSMADITKYLGLDFNNARVTIGQLVDAAIHFGVASQVLNTEQEARQALADGKAVILLLYNGLLDPLPYPHSPGWIDDHYIVWQDTIDGKRDEVMDPLAYPGSQQIIVTDASIVAAVHHVPIQQWGLTVYKHPASKAAPPRVTGPKTRC